MSSVFWANFSLELRKQFAYRADFWVNFILHAGGRLTVVYFFWKSVFAVSGKSTIGGLSFEQTMVYFFIVLFVDLSVRGSAQKVSVVAQEVYDGTLSRYLLYPANYFAFKISRILVFVVLALIQMSFGYFLMGALIGFENPMFEFNSILQGLVSLVPALILYFLCSATLEMVAFWAEGVWSLNVILRFVSGFLGGNFMPLAMFPEAWQKVLTALPFYSMVGFPAEAFMGRHSWQDVVSNLGLSALWTMVFLGFSFVLWRQGLKRFAGVGI